MSHIVEIKTEIRDPVAVLSAARRMELPVPQNGTFQLFSSAVTGLGVQSPEWRYPVVCDLFPGQVRYDNFAGRWGEQRHLDKLFQCYAVEKSKLEAAKQRYSAFEQSLPDGSIRVTVQVGGVA